jgi:S1-C subfamily serine protease
MRIDGASEGKPAQKAGLLKGDVITKLGTFSINSIEDYMSALGKLEPGTSTTVEILRNNQPVTLPIQL